MKYNIRGKKIEVTDSIKKYIESKLDRLDKYLDGSSKIEAKVLISTKGINQKVEVTFLNGKYNIRAEESHEDLYASIDLVVDKLERQLRKYKNKLTDKRKKQNRKVQNNEEPIIEDEEVKSKVIRRKEVYLKPIDEEEAITQMELLDHSFFVYKDINTNKVNVVYKRTDENYGIIEVN